MSPPEIKPLQQILAKLTRKRAANEKRVRELDDQPLDRSTLEKLKILRLELQRLEREIHMHQRQLERLREQTDGV